MAIDDFMDENRTPLQMRRVCPRRELYRACLDLYGKYRLSSLIAGPVTGLPSELDNVGKRMGYHDMHALRGAFQRIEIDALNESNRKGGNPMAAIELDRLMDTFLDKDWVYFDSRFNTCMIDELDTCEKPENYFEYFYGDYIEGFILAKMREAGDLYGVTFMDRRGFLYWLSRDGDNYLQSLPLVERACLNRDIVIMDNWELFDHLGEAES